MIPYTLQLLQILRDQDKIGGCGFRTEILENCEDEHLFQ